MQKSANVVDLFTVKYFTCFVKYIFHNLGDKKTKIFLSAPAVVGPRLYIKLQFFKYATVTFLWQVGAGETNKEPIWMW